jgi:antirestriction protein
MADDTIPRRIAASPDVLVQELPGHEIVLLHLASEAYFGLNEVGRDMWNALTRTGSVDRAHEELRKEYRVDDDTLRSDLEDLVAKLIERGLLEVRS